MLLGEKDVRSYQPAKIIDPGKSYLIEVEDRSGDSDAYDPQMTIHGGKCYIDIRYMDFLGVEDSTRLKIDCDSLIHLDSDTEVIK